MLHLHRLAMTYDGALRRRPLTVKALTSGLINAAADACMQTGTRKADTPHDMRRTLLYGGLYGAVWYGPFMHAVTTTWGRILPSTTIPSLAFKAVVDVCTSFPINLVGVISLQAYCRGADPWHTVRENHLNSWTTGMLFWPAANMIVYRLEPIYRVLCLNTCSFFWNCGMICFFCSSASPSETAVTLRRVATSHGCGRSVDDTVERVGTERPVTSARP